MKPLLNTVDHPLPTEPGTWTESFPVRSYEAGPSGRVKPLSLVHYFQEIAGIHASVLGLSVEQLFEQNLTWMLARIHYRFLRLPQMGAMVHVKTWPSGIQGLFATREFQAYLDNGDLVAEGTSAWLMFDLERRRPVRLPEVVNTILIPSLERPIADTFPKMRPLPQGYSDTSIFKAHYEDLDLNNHVNNAVYVDWIMRSTPLHIKQKAILRSIMLSFKAEVVAGQTIEMQTEQTEAKAGIELHHRLGTPENDSEVALAKATWEWKPA